MRAFVLVALVACTHDVEPEYQPPVPEEETPLPQAEVVWTGKAPIDVAVDDKYVYWLDAWTELLPTGNELRGSVERWDKLTGEIVVLASIRRGVPADLAVADEHVYWSELYGWQSNGRRLGEDRLVRVAKTGGTPQVVATEQYFDSATPRPNVVASTGHVYWASEGMFSQPSGALYRVRDADPLATVQPIGSKLDQPNGIATDGTTICFRTGHPNQTSPIWCAPVAGGPIVDVAYGFPYAMTFFQGHLYWSDRAISRTRVDLVGDVERVEPAQRPVHLVADATAIFWSDAPELVLGGDTIRMRDATGVRTLWKNEEQADRHPRALASDGEHLYFITHFEPQVRRIPLD